MFIFAQESGLLQTASPFYKTFAIECSRAQVSVDMFLFSAAYQDVATLGTTRPSIIVQLTNAVFSLPSSLHLRTDVFLSCFQRGAL